MRIRSARTLVFSREGGEIVGFNYLSGASFGCSADLLGFLTSLDDFTDPADLPALAPGLTPDELGSATSDLVGVTALVEEDSTLAVAEADLATSWRWGLPAALFHFSLCDRDFMAIEELEKVQMARIAAVPQPGFYDENDRSTALPLPSAMEDNELIALMAKRRTVREVARSSITLAALSDCLFAGMGIIGQTENCVGKLPLSMTPSGGARNPYEAYVYARSVDGLPPGFYHYAAIDHTLARVETNEMPMPSELLGGQQWTDAMPCVLLLYAHFERTMWKYDDANAYRVVLIEAGHIGQNVMLAATRNGLSACPTAALNHTRINDCIAPKARLTHAPIYALTLSQPRAEDGVSASDRPARVVAIAHH
jgi:SagB-type dehydrogenase family enzyme